MPDEVVAVQLEDACAWLDVPNVAEVREGEGEREGASLLPARLHCPWALRLCAFEAIHKAWQLSALLSRSIPDCTISSCLKRSGASVAASWPRQRRSSLAR